MRRRDTSYPKIESKNLQPERKHRLVHGFLPESDSNQIIIYFESYRLPVCTIETGSDHKMRTRQKEKRNNELYKPEIGCRLKLIIKKNIPSRKKSG